LLLLLLLDGAVAWLVGCWVIAAAAAAAGAAAAEE
jgi:hypothetical protein